MARNLLIGQVSITFEHGTSHMEFLELSIVFLRIVFSFLSVMFHKVFYYEICNSVFVSFFSHKGVPASCLMNFISARQ